MPSKELRSLDQIMDGALTERFNAALNELWRNVFDHNTDPNRIRSISLTFKFKPNEARDVAAMLAEVKTTLAPPVPLAQTVLIQQHDDGSVTAIEHTNQITGQIDMGGNENIPNVITFTANKH
jgi:hypothetical protein